MFFRFCFYSLVLAICGGGEEVICLGNLANMLRLHSGHGLILNYYNKVVIRRK
jgi:hypothetical protein